jgi:hypothetical protein
VKKNDFLRLKKWIQEGFTEAMKTPDSTMIFVTEEEKDKITFDQIDCMGCLSGCKFSNWHEIDKETKHYADLNTSAKEWTTGTQSDPRSFCIQKTLHLSARTDDIENNLMFAGKQAFMFNQDPFYKNGKFMPTTAQLINRIMTGE